MERSKSFLHINVLLGLHYRADKSLLVCVILRLCGEHPDGALTVSSNKNKINVLFFSDASYVDRGFDAEFETIDSKDRK